MEFIKQHKQGHCFFLLDPVSWGNKHGLNRFCLREAKKVECSSVVETGAEDKPLDAWNKSTVDKPKRRRCNLRFSPQ